MNKTKWYTRPVYLLVALALVLSLGVAGTVSQPNAQEVSASPDSPSLMVDIVKVIDQYGVEKYPPYSFNVSEDFLVNAAIAYKDIEKEGAASVSVSATIDPGQYVNLKAGEDSTKALGSIARNNVTDVWWWVHCNGTGISTITVTASDGGLTPASDSITVAQGEEAAETVLVVDIIECPSGTTLQESDNFVIKARVNNTGYIIAEDVWGTISIPAAVNASMADPPGNPDSWELGDIWPGESAEVMWNLHCDGPGEGNVTIDATASNLDPTQIQEAICHVYQETPTPGPTPGKFWVTVDAQDKVCNSPCCPPLNQFTVNATVCNNYGANATNVNVTLNMTGGAHLPTGENATHSLGNIPNGTCSNITTWNVSCDSPGPVVFTVTTSGAGQSWANGVSGTDSTSQQDYILQIMEVINPNPGQNLTYPNVTGNTTSLETCQNLTVSTSFQNCLDEMLSNVTFTIDLPDSVELAPGSMVHVVQTNLNGTEIDNYEVGPPPAESVLVYTICGCCNVNITWQLHCKESSLGVAENITVTAYDDGGLLDSDYFKVIQIEKAHLAAGIEVYPGWVSGQIEAPQNAAAAINNFVGYSTLVTTAVGAVYVCQNFTIVIPIFNLGEAYATNVSVNYTISGNTSCVLNKTLGYTNYTSPIRSLLAGGEAAKILIPCHCEGEEDVTITVTAINGIDEITGEQVIDDNKYLPDPKDIMQIPFEVTIIQPLPGTNFSCSDEFAVKVIINNTSTDPGNDVSGVNATIAWTGPGCANFVDEANQSYTIPLGDLDVNGTAQEAAWLMHCCGMGDVYFTVTVTAQNPLMNIVETVTVHQLGTTTLGVTIISPEEDSPTYATCEQFAVTAKVYNVGNKTAPNVTASIKPGAYCEVLGSPTIEIGTLEAGEYQLISWTLHVYEAGAACWILPNSIYVWVTAPCAAMGVDSETVLVYPAAHLVVEAEAPTEVEVGSKFNVTATVTNTGWADATQVVLRIDTGANSALAPGESLTKTIETLVGFWVHEDANVTWTLQCEGEGKSTIIITPEGNDECGWYYNGTAWTNQPGRVINPAFLKPDDVTVEQKTIIPGPEVTTIGIVTDWNFISVPKKMENATVGKLLEGISYAVAYGYNATTGYFVLLSSSSPVVVLDGYWIDANAPGTITLTYASGGMMLPPSKDLTGKAWNAIGFSSTSEYGLSAEATLKSVEGSWSTLLGWNAAGQSYEGAIITEVNDDEKMYPGKGYWLWVTEDTTLAAVGA